MPAIPVGIKKVACLIILRNEDKFLLLKRNKEPNKGLFTPVGGKLEPYENPYHSAIRETREETGISTDTLRFCGTLVESSPTKYNWMNFVYIADIDFLSPPDCNEGKLSWVSFKELGDIPSPETDWHIYQYAIQQKPFAFNADFDEHLRMIQMKEEIEGIWVKRKMP